MERVLVTVTPRTFNASVHWMSVSLDGTEKLCLCFLSTKITSLLLSKFSFRLLSWANSGMCYISEERVSTLTAGIMMYVSSAYLHNSLPADTAFKSELLMT